MTSLTRATAIAVLTAALATVPAAQTPPPRRPVPRPGPTRRSSRARPTGEVIKAEFAESKIYPGTWREYWVYIPKQLDRSKPAPVMVFQDGLQYNAPVVFDNLIHKKAIPPMVGVFVMHGRVQGAVRRRARSDEPQLRVRRGQRRLRALPGRRDAAARREDARPDAVDRSERSRDRRQQQRRHRGVRRRVAAARRVPARLQRHRHLRRPARRQRRCRC